MVHVMSDRMMVLTWHNIRVMTIVSCLRFSRTNCPPSVNVKCSFRLVSCEHEHRDLLKCEMLRVAEVRTKYYYPNCWESTSQRIYPPK